MWNIVGAAGEAPHMVTAGIVVVAGGPKWRFPEYKKKSYESLGNEKPKKTNDILMYE